ncbi:serine/threonine-protein kinase [Micromonospora parathelypteridis]|uniref:non-specific serine/threonine protein kinase n=1 Tax=Micromonospora parathelypteridis TaxID=1839617 RepID=A0A840W7N4_9ACTN|nr:serine/threonine-protein kinase [Micromonospora parathelypteridis]MBB5479081.1 serine/threonine protein kinase [Micromonospora parathelypteridis]
MSNALPQLVADRYRLLSPLGQGGMGRVWKARDEVLHRDVAIKELVPPPGLTDEERREMRERSLREARAIARLNHANVVRIFDVLRTDGDPWIVMEYVASRSLQDTLAEDGPVSVARTVEIGLGVLGALNAAHKAGVMHRDVKPGNVLLGEDGRVVLTDFGLATIPGDPNVTRTGMVLGSPAYISPERAREGTAGPEADLWSLGATLYAAVEGKSPYARPSAIATLAALATEPMPPPKNAGPLKAVLNGLLRKDPNERITAEVAERLLRRAGGKRARGISLLDGVRRPGPNGPREPRPPLVPAPRPAESVDRPVSPPPAAAATSVAAAAGPAADATPTTVVPSGEHSDPTAPVPADPTAVVPAEPTATIDSPSDADPTAKVTATADTTGDGTANVDDEPTVVDGPPVAPEQRKPTTPTSLMPPVSPAGRAAVPPSDGTKPNNTRRNVLIGALVALLLIGLVVIVPMLTKGDDNETPQTGPTTGAAATSAPAQSSAPAAPPPTTGAPSASPSATPSTDPNALPAGWKLHEGPTFSIPLPPGWSGRQTSSDTVVFNQSGGPGKMLVQWTSSPKKDAVVDWKGQEPYRKSLVNNYQLVGSIKSCDWYRTCADWEWLETRDGTRIHVRNRGFVTATNRGYAIRWEIAEKDWQANLANFDQIVKGFKPDRVN